MKEFLKKHWKDCLLVLLLIVIVALGIYISYSVNRVSIAENNIIALRDTIETYNLKNGELMNEKQLLILEKDELEKYVGISNDYIKDVEKKLNSSISYIAKLEASVKVDTLFIVDSVYVTDDTISATFRYDDEWIIIDGETSIIDTTYAETNVNCIEVNAPLKIGITENNQFFVSTDNPYINISSIDGSGIVTNKTKTKRWNVGVQAGIGFQYGMINKHLDIGPYIGVGISYGFSF